MAADRIDMGWWQGAGFHATFSKRLAFISCGVAGMTL
jgi:hypothetical protein